MNRRNATSKKALLTGQNFVRLNIFSRNRQQTGSNRNKIKPSMIKKHKIYSNRENASAIKLKRSKSTTNSLSKNKSKSSDTQQRQVEHLQRKSRLRQLIIVVGLNITQIKMKKNLKN